MPISLALTETAAQHVVDRFAMPQEEGESAVDALAYGMGEYLSCEQTLQAFAEAVIMTADAT